MAPSSAFQGCLGWEGILLSHSLRRYSLAHLLSSGKLFEGILKFTICYLMLAGYQGKYSQLQFELSAQPFLPVQPNYFAKLRN